MGQISLPRLNRLNNSMFWESSIFFKNYSYNSLKLYIFYKYFLKYFFKYINIFYFFNWKINNINFTFNNGYLYFKKWENDDTTFLKFYLYNFNLKYYIFVIYSNFFKIKSKTLLKLQKNYFFKSLTIYL